MQNNKLYNLLQLLYICLVMAFVLTGCTKEDMSDCEPIYSIVVRAFDADNKDITETQQVKEVKLYLFDSNNEYLNTQDAKVGQTVILDYHDKESFNVIVWGNCAQGNQIMPTLSVGDKLETAFVSLMRKIKVDLPIAVSPDDIFFGSSTITKQTAKGEVIPIARKVSSITITARRLKQYAADMDGDYAFLVRETNDKYDFRGNPSGERVCYGPSATFDAQDDFVTPIFNILSTTTPIEVDIYNRAELVATVTKDNNGNLIKIEEGRLLNILIDFSANISVDVSVTPWGKKQIWKEFR